MKLLQFVCGFCLVSFLTAAPATAAVFKCKDSTGRTSFQEQPCPETAKGAEVSVSGVQAALSPEDQMWMNDRKSMLRGMCGDALNVARLRASLSSDERSSICDCGVQKLFRHPVAKLRKMEEMHNSKGMRELMDPIASSCANELLATRRRK